MARELAKQMLAQSGHLSPTLSTEQPRQRQNARVISAAWRAQSAGSQNQWLALAQIINAQEGRYGKQALNGYTAFFILNSTRLTSGLALLTDAPAAPAPPAATPPLLLAAAFDPDAGGLSLTAPGAPAYPDRVIVYGAKPLLVGQDVFPGTKFKRLGALPHLNGVSVLSGLYQSQFYVPGDGYQIVLRLVAVSATGARSAPVQLTCQVEAPGAAQAAAPGDDRAARPALKAA